MRPYLSVGYGQSVLQKDAAVSGSIESITRNETPLAVAVGVDRPWGDRWLGGIEHARGVRMSPFSSGISFTGIHGKWFPGLGPVTGPRNSEQKPSVTRILDGSLRPYVGLGVGVAIARVSRPDEVVTALEDSGVYFSPKLGAEFLQGPGRAGRVELGIFSASGSDLANGGVSGVHLVYSWLFLP